MILQQAIIQNYFDLIGNKSTLKKMSEDLGINITRVFRLLQGAEMKLSEYEKFKNFIAKHDANINELPQLSKRCLERLSRKSQSEIKILMMRKLSLWEFMQKPQENISIQLVA
ncbi:MAG: hypothetical protein A2504_14055 [Bdellovibrionales bacterium RIFOXYD12_FULL_39_22]|nr:MAG: hypothetical protein A2385_04490 [Bdellovibrionales bacterium RIFOXYB1_FULL_39_21]OFZ43406.1 MAG: hypothetical protein A2485_13005 [Bdellovibrionales bacterium RIFOXYC12_FULL_39_17]OFZ46949.1 MAG: hypothetical protein A2404_00065 [Bdellovibrionales bacterium RIFOXYC1_FULL_39_130]OFZ71456.1 MAG: hypothetical protein A2451_12585 [Bdellovibrionales bacterium RIFOXYC2_FULL_39_8]OFZ76146.1 MAG: hypothetical protein A2560_07315 [Bdellovibrionales bacterium RIFOXYD1_FULL_39_84]OFZ94381.1 MAG: